MAGRHGRFRAAFGPRNYKVEELIVVMSERVAKLLLEKTS